MRCTVLVRCAIAAHGSRTEYNANLNYISKHSNAHGCAHCCCDVSTRRCRRRRRRRRQFIGRTSVVVACANARHYASKCCCGCSCGCVCDIIHDEFIQHRAPLMRACVPYTTFAVAVFACIVQIMTVKDTVISKIVAFRSSLFSPHSSEKYYLQSSPFNYHTARAHTHTHIHSDSRTYAHTFCMCAACYRITLRHHSSSSCMRMHAGHI